MEVCVSRGTVKRIINIGDVGHPPSDGESGSTKQTGVRKHMGISQKI